MRNSPAVFAALTIAVLLVGCRSELGGISVPPGVTNRPAESPAAAAGMLGVGTPTPACPPANGYGTVAPAISIYSLTFLVNGAEQVILDGGALQVSADDQVELREAVVCAALFPGVSGQACVDLVPVDRTGQEIASEHAGSHLVEATPGFMTVPGPDHLWTVSDSWRGFSAVVNHWPPVETKDFACAGGGCERDDRVFVPIR